MLKKANTILLCMMLMALTSCKMSDCSRTGSNLSRMMMLSGKLEAYYELNKSYPTTKEGLNELKKEMIRIVPRDGWGNLYHYVSDGQSYLIVSEGPDPSTKEDNSYIIYIDKIKYEHFYEKKKTFLDRLFGLVSFLP